MTPDPSYQPKRHIAIIESARGFAAVYVLLTHIIELTGLHKNPGDGSALKLFIDLFLIYGHQAVILFFVLSGFSIHYTSVDRNLVQLTVLKHYYYLRWRRVYPIFFLAVFITLSLDIAGSAIGINMYRQHLSEVNSSQLLYTFTFLTDVHDVDGMLQPVLLSNGPLWSLSYGAFFDITWGLLFFFIMLLYISKENTNDMNRRQKALTVFVAVIGYLVIIAGVERLGFVTDLILFYSHISLTLILLVIGLYIPHLDIQSISKTLLKPLYPFGKSSYGIYVIHYPMLLFSVQLLIYLKFSAWWCVAFVPFILAAANLIELHYQPFMLRITDPIATRMEVYKKGKTLK